MIPGHSADWGADVQCRCWDADLIMITKVDEIASKSDRNSKQNPCRPIQRINGGKPQSTAGLHTAVNKSSPLVADLILFSTDPGRDRRFQITLNTIVRREDSDGNLRLPSRSEGRAVRIRQSDNMMHSRRPSISARRKARARASETPIHTVGQVASPASLLTMSALLFITIRVVMALVPNSECFEYPRRQCKRRR